MKKKNKTHSFARRLTRWIAFTQLIVMGLASWLIYKTAKNLVMMEEISRPVFSDTPKSPCNRFFR